MDAEHITNYVREILDAHCRKWQTAIPASHGYNDIISMIENDIASLREAVKELEAKK